MPPAFPCNPLECLDCLCARVVELTGLQVGRCRVLREEALETHFEEETTNLPTCPMTIGPAPMIMIFLISLRFLTSAMATCQGRGAACLVATAA
jgi:hypothetical protein